MRSPLKLLLITGSLVAATTRALNSCNLTVTNSLGSSVTVTLWAPTY